MIRIDDGTVFNPENGQFGYLPEIIQFEADRYLLTDATPATVTWTITNATRVLLNGQQVDSTGTLEYHSNERIVVNLVAENELGQCNSRELLIEIDHSPPIIHSFSISETFASVGSPIQLRWQTEGDFELEIDNGIGSVKGLTSKTVTLSEVGVFQLKAKSFFGIISTAEVSITIFPIPLIKGIEIPMFTLNQLALTNNQPHVTVNIDLCSKELIRSLELTQLDSVANKFTFETIKFSTEALGNYYFHELTKKQKEIAHIIRGVWRRKFKNRLKKIFRPL